MESGYHFFSDKEYAGPHHSSLITFWDREPRTLRKTPRQIKPEYVFPESRLRAIVEIAKLTDSKMISRFWNKYYNGKDWNFNCTYGDVERWMKSGFIIFVKHDEEIVGTFVCRFLKGVFCGKHNPQAAILDGLVVHPNFRKIGLASFLLASMDYTVYNNPEYKEALLIWFRESVWKISLYNQMPISVLKYSYINIDDIPVYNKIVNVTNYENIENIVKKISHNTQNLFSLICYDFDHDVLWFQVDDSIIGFANTHRTAQSGYAIWEVVFAANKEPPYFENLQKPIELAAKKLPCSKGLLFVTNGLSRGNLSELNEPWVSGNSGYLSTHVYNWMPPRFLNGDILFPFSCI